MALELIQNADDAGALSLTFDVTDDSLFVRNGASFSTCGLSEPRCPWESQGDSSGLRRACNFHAISRMGSRNKIRSEEHTSELQSLMRISYAVFCLKKKNKSKKHK